MVEQINNERKAYDQTTANRPLKQKNYNDQEIKHKKARISVNWFGYYKWLFLVEYQRYTLKLTKKWWSKGSGMMRNGGRGKQKGMPWTKFVVLSTIVVSIHQHLVCTRFA